MWDGIHSEDNLGIMASPDVDRPATTLPSEEGTEGQLPGGSSPPVTPRYRRITLSRKLQIEATSDERATNVDARQRLRSTFHGKRSNIPQQHRRTMPKSSSRLVHEDNLSPTPKPSPNPSCGSCTRLAQALQEEARRATVAESAADKLLEELDRSRAAREKLGSELALAINDVTHVREDGSRRIRDLESQVVSAPSSRLQ